MHFGCPIPAGPRSQQSRTSSFVPVEVDPDGERGGRQRPPDRRVPLVAHRAAAGDRVVVGQQDGGAGAPAPSDQDPDPQVGGDVAYVVGLPLGQPFRSRESVCTAVRSTKTSSTATVTAGAAISGRPTPRKAADRPPPGRVLIPRPRPRPRTPVLESAKGSSSRAPRAPPGHGVGSWRWACRNLPGNALGGSPSRR
jgi:hypothetical protein